MVRELKKPSKGLAELEAMEKDTDRVVAEIHKKREKDFGNDLDCDNFFCVVFDTNAERDKWLEDRKLHLKIVENRFIKASDFNL